MMDELATIALSKALGIPEDIIPNPPHESAREIVRAIPQRLREPTPEMVEAGQAILEDPEITRPDGAISVVEGDAFAVFTAMLDAITEQG